MGYHTVFMHYALAGGESKERYCQIFVRGFPVKEQNPDGELCWKGERGVAVFLKHPKCIRIKIEKIALDREIRVWQR